ncbi:hypothetical protein [Mameliella alba]|uniref:hypothetical protein n=1 Tax=Mameliella alba TaxID=561184 RepID=UPI00142FDF79|nr:hypothetical protein [Mameliella alba]
MLAQPNQWVLTLSESQYANIGRTVLLLSAIEYELYRTLSAAFGTAEEDSLKTAARGTFNQRKAQLSRKLNGDKRIRPEALQVILKKLETASELRDQFFHGVWVTHGERITSKFIKRHNCADGANGAAVHKIEMPHEKFALIHRNLEYILVELDVIQEILGKD